MHNSAENSCRKLDQPTTKANTITQGSSAPLRLLLLALTTTLLIGLAGSCKKDKGGEEEKNTLELMTASSWKLDTVGLDMDKNGEIDAEIPGGIEACDKDNTLTFYNNNTGLYAEGATKCDTDGPDAVPFAWSLQNDDKVLVIEGELPEQLNGNINILKVTATEMVLSKQFQITTPITISTHVIVKLKK